jgi:integrase
MAWVEHTSGQHWRVRYRHDGTVASECGFSTWDAADDRAREITTDHRAVPAHPRGVITVDAWLPRWWTTLDLDEVTIGNYQCLVDKHIAPRFGHRPLDNILTSDITTWSRELHAAGYEHSTVEGIIGLFSRILGDAVEDGLLPTNPVHRHKNRGKRAFRIPHEMLWATPEEVLRGAQQAAHLHNRASALLIITAAWTGCRWGELAGLQRHNTRRPHHRHRPRHRRAQRNRPPPMARPTQNTSQRPHHQAAGIPGNTAQTPPRHPRPADGVPQ